MVFFLPSGMHSMGSNRSMGMRSSGGDGGGGGSRHEEDMPDPPADNNG